MSLGPGTRLGSYEVVASLGEAPAERYKANDTRTNREVSIRVVPTDGTLAGDARARLEREAKALASLRHPNISVPIEIGHEDPATDFVVSEHVEGETLGQRLAHHALELPEALQIAAAIVDSLDKAHRKGLVHGGLTPATVWLSAGGPILLDFGLARLAEGGPQDGFAPLATLAAVRMPTAPSSARAAITACTAPEQLAGMPADARTDIYACGALLYEMLAGRPAFQEKTQALLVAAIQSVDPEPLSKLQPLVPAALDHLVQRCLSKDPKERVQTAWDLLVQLKWIGEGGSKLGVPAPAIARRRKQDRIVWAAAAAALVVALALTPSVLSSFGTPPTSPAVRFAVAGLPPQANVPISISPDGRWVAGAAQGGSEIIGVSLGSLTPQRLVTAGAAVLQPFWSPDSRSIAFFEGGLLKRAEIAGGPPQTVAEAPPPVGNGTWSKDGVILFSSGGVIRRVLAAGGEPTPITDVDENGQPISGEDHLGPWFLPDGRHFLYVAVSNDSAIYLAELDSTARTRLISAESKPMYAPGYILFNRGATLFAQPFDAEALALTGEPIRVTDGLAMLAPTASANLANSANFSVSQTGALVFKSSPGGAAGDATGAGLQRSLVWVDRTGAQLGEAGTGGIAGIELAPDGERFAVHVHEGEGGDIWTFDPDQRRLQRFTFDASQENSSPVWSPDGSRIAFASRRGNGWGLYVKQADGAGEEELVFESTEQKVPMSWSPDGKLLVYVQIGNAPDIWAVPLDGDKRPFPVANSPAVEAQPQVSPDGKWVAYQSSETGVAEIYIKQFPEGPAKRQVSTGGGAWPRWRADGKELYFNSSGINAVEIDMSGTLPRPGVPRLLFTGPGNPNLTGHFVVYHRFAVSPDGQRFLIALTAGGGAGLLGGAADAAIRNAIDNANAGTGGAAAVARVSVVLNWPQMLQER
jgi:serine/threonine protein kinase/Tol biopolymer transport system component